MGIIGTKTSLSIPSTRRPMFLCSGLFPLAVRTFSEGGELDAFFTLGLSDFFGSKCRDHNRDKRPSHPLEQPPAHRSHLPDKQHTAHAIEGCLEDPFRSTQSRRLR